MSIIAVPSFFLISGYLFFSKGLTKLQYKQNLKKRLHSLLIPYVLWNLIALFVLLLPHLHSYDLSFENVIACFWDCHYSFIHSQSHSPINYPLWYVRDLLFCNILSPLIFWVISCFKWVLPIVSLLLWIIGFDISHTGFSVIALSFYSIGAYFSLTKQDKWMNYCNYSSQIGVMFLIVSLLLSIYPSIPYGDVISRFFTLVGIAGAFQIASYINRANYSYSKLICNLGNSSFLIFAAHAIIIKHVNNLLIKLEIFPNFGVYLLTPLLAISFCYGLYLSFLKITPKISKYLTGR